MTGFHFALIDLTGKYGPADLYLLKEPLELLGRDCAQAWGVERPAVDAIDSLANLPKWMCPLVFVDDDNPGTLAEHWWDPIRRLPAARVYTRHDSGLMSGRHSACEAAGHEVAEAMCNADLGNWRTHPDSSRSEVLQVPLEVADATQDTYGVTLRDGTEVQVANFLWPAWFDRSLSEDPVRLREYLDGGGKLDQAGRLKAPGQLGPEGYTIVRRPRDDGFGWTRWAEWGPTAAAAVHERANAATKHPLSRSRRLLGEAVT